MLEFGCMSIHGYTCICIHMHRHACICRHMQAFACISMHGLDLERPMLSRPMQRGSSHTAGAAPMCSHAMAYDWHAMAYATACHGLWQGM